MKWLVPLVLLAGCSAVGPLPRSGPYAVRLEDFNDTDFGRLWKVLEKPTACVDLPLTRVASRVDILDFMFEELPFTAGVLRAMNEGKYEIWRDEPLSTASEEQKRIARGSAVMDDNDGVLMRLDLIRAEPDRRIYYGFGSFDLGLFTVFGRTVIIVTYEERDGALWTQARVYAKIRGLALEQGAKLLGLVEKTIRNKSGEFIKMATRVAEMAAAEPRAVADRVRGSAEIDPAVLAEFERRFAR